MSRLTGRTKIRQWFRQQNRDENITAGRQILERELNRLGIDNKSYQEVASLFKVENLDDFLEKLGTGDHTPADVAEHVLQLGKVEELPKEAAATLPPQEALNRPRSS